MGTETKSLTNIEQVSRWLALIEGVNYISSFAHSKKINEYDLKPCALNKYVEERVATIIKDLEYEQNLPTL